MNRNGGVWSHSGQGRGLAVMAAVLMLLTAAFPAVSADADTGRETGGDGGSGGQGGPGRDGGRASANGSWGMLGGGPGHAGLSSYSTAQNGRGVARRLMVNLTGDIVMDSAGTIYAGVRNGFCAIYRNFSVAWTLTTADAKHYGDEDTVPAVGPNGVIYATSLNGNLYALEPNGAVRWKFNTGNSFSTSPVVSPDGTVYAASMNLAAFSPEGNLSWSAVLEPNTFAQPGTTPAVGPDGTVYCLFENYDTHESSLRAFRGNGTSVWTCNFKTAFSFVAELVAAPDGTIYVVDYRMNSDETYTGTIWTVAANGTLKWGKQFGTVLFAPAIGPDGTCYVSARDGNITAFNPIGEVVWKYQTGDYTYRLTVDSDGNILFTTSMYLKSVGPSGTLNWNLRLPFSHCMNPVVWKDGTIYMRNSNSLMAVNNGVVFGSELEKSKPVISIEYPPPLFITNCATVEVRGTVSGPIELLQLKSTLNPGYYPKGSQDIPFNLSGGVAFWHYTQVLEEGLNTIQLEAVDWVQNSNAGLFWVTLDTAPPVVNVSWPREKAKLAVKDIHVCGTVSDNLGNATVEVSVDGLNWTLAPGCPNWSQDMTLQQGVNRIIVRATDRAGNNASRVVEVSVDTRGRGTTVADGNIMLAIIIAILIAVGLAAAFLSLRHRERKRG